METAPKKRALIVIFEGVEELEAVAAADLLRRAGVECVVAALGAELLAEGRNGIRLLADTRLGDVINGDYDAIVLPGGPGHKLLREHPVLIEKLKQQAGAGKLIGAICASPLVLKDAGLLEGRRYTAHPSTVGELMEIRDGQAVAEDGPLITSRGAGTAVEFALALAGRLAGKEKAEETAAAVCRPPI